MEKSYISSDTKTCIFSFTICVFVCFSLINIHYVGILLLALLTKQQVFGMQQVKLYLIWKELMNEFLTFSGYCCCHEKRYRIWNRKCIEFLRFLEKTSRLHCWAWKKYLIRFDDQMTLVSSYKVWSLSKPGVSVWTFVV